MKLTIDRNALMRALSHVQAVVERRNTIPILSNILMVAEGDRLLREPFHPLPRRGAGRAALGLRPRVPPTRDPLTTTPSTLPSRNLPLWRVHTGRNRDGSGRF